MNTELIAKLRKETNLALLDCVNALKSFNGDYEKAKADLLEKNRKVRARIADRLTSEGAIESYIHHNYRTGVLVELDCETDFVAKHEDFVGLARQIAMHIASAKPRYVSESEVPRDEIDKKRTEFSEGLEKKPENIKAKIIEGKMAKWLSEFVLLYQPFVMDDKKTIQELVNESISKFGENIVVRKFARFDIKE